MLLVTGWEGIIRAVGDYLNRYIDGWTKRDTQIPTGSLAKNNYLDDSNSGKITKQAVGEYLNGLWQIVEGIRGKTHDPLLMRVAYTFQQPTDWDKIIVLNF